MKHTKPFVLAVLISIFMFVAAVPAFAQNISKAAHSPQCRMTKEDNVVTVLCEDAGSDIVKADIIPYTPFPNKYVVDVNGETAEIRVYLNGPSALVAFAWIVGDQQGNFAKGYYPAAPTDG